MKKKSTLMHMQQMDQWDGPFSCGFLLILCTFSVCALVEISHLTQKKKKHYPYNLTKENCRKERLTKLIKLRWALSKLGFVPQDSACIRSCFSVVALVYTILSVLSRYLLVLSSVFWVCQVIFKKHSFGGNLDSKVFPSITDYTFGRTNTDW